MEFKKPKFWDYKKPNVYSYLLWPISILIRLFNFLKIIITIKNYFKFRKKIYHLII